MSSNTVRSNTALNLVSETEMMTFSMTPQEIGKLITRLVRKVTEASTTAINLEVEVVELKRQVFELKTTGRAEVIATTPSQVLVDELRARGVADLNT